MQLFMTLTSPYARKARVLARERGVVLEERVSDPHNDDPALIEANPIGKVPALRTETDGVIAGSEVIVRYLDQLGPGEQLDPGSWSDRTLASTADGLLDCAVSIVLDRRREPAQQSAAHVARQQAKIMRTVETLEVPDSQLTLGRIGLGCALDYLDFRHPDLNWRAKRPDLASWLDAVLQRPSFADTAPPKS